MMRTKTAIIILTVILTVLLGAVAFLIGMLLGDTRQQTTVQNDSIAVQTSESVQPQAATSACSDVQTEAVTETEAVSAPEMTPASVSQNTAGTAQQNPVTDAPPVPVQPAEPQQQAVPQQVSYAETESMYNQFYFLSYDDYYAPYQAWVDLNGDGLNELLLIDDAGGRTYEIYHWTKDGMKRFGLAGVMEGNATYTTLSLVRGYDGNQYLYFENDVRSYAGFYNGSFFGYFNLDTGKQFLLEEKDGTVCFHTSESVINQPYTDNYIDAFYAFIQQQGFGVDASCSSEPIVQQDCRSLLHDLAGSKNDGFYRTQSEMGCVSTITATLNLRSGASTSSDIIVRIPPGTFVNIDMNWDSMVSDFFRVDVLVDGILYRGYVSKDYILYRNIFHV